MASAEPRVVLDASALIAVLWQEPGGDEVEPLLDGSAISAVNWAEVLQRYAAAGLPMAGRRASIEGLGVRIEPVTGEDSEVVAELWGRTRAAGLSIADRVCLALGRRLEAAVYTADRDWRKLDVGATVVLIR